MNLLVSGFGKPFKVVLFFAEGLYLGNRMATITPLAQVRMLRLVNVPAGAVHEWLGFSEPFSLTVVIL